MLKTDKEVIIKMIMDLRTHIGDMVVPIVEGVDNQDAVDEAQRKLNSIQDKVFTL